MLSFLEKQDIRVVGYAALSPKRMEKTLFVSGVAAGFPSPADDYIERNLDLNEFLIQKPAATFHVRVSGNSMVEAGILEGDYLIVDRSVTPFHNATVVAVVEGEMMVKKFWVTNGTITLAPGNADYQPIVVREGMDITIWGVVSGVYRKTL